MSSSLGARTTADEVLLGRDLSGHNMLVTGCNAGIGFETARALAAHGAHVWIACRDRAKADQTCARIRALHPAVELTPLAIDLGSLTSIRAAVAGLTLDKLHTLICNAGLYSAAYSESSDGLELTVGVSHVGHFLLTTLLLDKLQRAAPARVVMVASESHRHPARLQLDRVPLDRAHYKPLVAYGQAKLANVLFASELERRFGASGVNAYSLHPGTMMGTSIYRSSIAAKLLALAYKPFAKSLAQGAATTVYCATAPELADRGGRYFLDCRERAASAEGRDAGVAQALWLHTEQLLARHDRGDQRPTETSPVTV